MGMQKLHIFNPGYEAGLLFGSARYTPPANVQCMQKELSLLPLWYADPSDSVWVERSIPSDFFSVFPSDFPPLARWISKENSLNYREELNGKHVTPWGLSLQIIRHFEEMNQKEKLNLNIPEWKQEYVSLTGRRTAAICLSKIRERLSGDCLPEGASFYSSITGINEYIQNRTPPFVVKTPYSSSGRGVLWIRENVLSTKDSEWINGFIRKQGEVSIEKGLDKIVDFALEYSVADAGEISFEGISLFETGEKGAYTGNRLEPQNLIEKRLADLVGESVFRKIRQAVGEVILEVYGPFYRGNIGVDMMIYKDEKGRYLIHPCVEINMRYTMGMLAVKLFERYICLDSSGSFQLTYDKNAYTHHTIMQKTYPPEWKSGKLLRGYLPLCPVYPETSYRAFVLIE